MKYQLFLEKILEQSPYGIHNDYDVQIFDPNTHSNTEYYDIKIEADHDAKVIYIEKVELDCE